MSHDEENDQQWQERQYDDESDAAIEAKIEENMNDKWFDFPANGNYQLVKRELIKKEKSGYECTIVHSNMDGLYYFSYRYLSQKTKPKLAKKETTSHYKRRIKHE